EVGDDSCREGANRVTEIPPEAIDTKGARPPNGVGCIGYGSDQARIHHCGAKPEKQAADEPPIEAAGRSGEEEAACLNPHAGNDEALAPPAIAELAGRYLEDAPCRRIYRLEDANALDAKSKGREEQRKYAPTHAVIEIVHEPGLRCGKEI